MPQTHVEDEWLIVVSLSKQELYLYRGSNLLHTYNVATGKEITPTPLGRWRIVQKEVLALGTEFGSRWMRIERFDPATQRYQWTDYGIHGTDEENKIGTPVSAGCIRMRNQDVEELYALVPMETMVITEQ